QRRAVAGRQRAARAAIEHGLQPRELLEARVGANVVVALDALIRNHEIGVEAVAVSAVRVPMARERELVLLLARDLPLLRRDLRALAHREPGARLDDAH